MTDITLPELDWYLFTTSFIIMLGLFIAAFRSALKYRHMYRLSLDKLIKAEDDIQDLKIKNLEYDHTKDLRDMFWNASNVSMLKSHQQLSGSFSVDSEYSPNDLLTKLFTDRDSPQGWGKTIWSPIINTKRLKADQALMSAGFMWDIWEGKAKWLPSGHNTPQLDTSDFKMLWTPDWEGEWKP